MNKKEYIAWLTEMVDNYYAFRKATHAEAEKHAEGGDSIGASICYESEGLMHAYQTAYEEARSKAMLITNKWEHLEVYLSPSTLAAIFDDLVSHIAYNEPDGVNDKLAEDIILRILPGLSEDRQKDFLNDGYSLLNKKIIESMIEENEKA